jgi:hypothetical protein
VAKDMTIHTYYESRPTSTVAEGPDGQWERRGEAKVMVERSSALLNFEPEKTRMKVDGDHKEIARLRRGQGGVYPNILRIIKEALDGASDQSSAAARAALAAEIEAQEAEMKAQAVKLEELAIKIVAEEASAAKPDPGVRVDKSTTGYRWDYDGYNLICDICYVEFPKTQMHYCCFICRDGNYNVCTICKSYGRSCSGGHSLMLRQPDYYEKEDQEEEKAGSKSIKCAVCCYVLHYRNLLRFYCGLCDFHICLACRKSGNICVSGHKLVAEAVKISNSTSNATTRRHNLVMPEAGNISNSTSDASGIMRCHNCDGMLPGCGCYSYRGGQWYGPPQRFKKWSTT